MTPKGVLLGAMTLIVVFVFGTAALFGQDKIEFLFTGKIKYIWIGLMAAIGIISTRLM